MDHIKGVNKKLVQYQSMDAEYHGLISMPLAEIFKGLYLMDAEPEELWKHMQNAFGPDFFLPTIDKLYSHRFVNDVGRHQRELEGAVLQSKQNELLIVEESKKQLGLLAKDKSDMMGDWLKHEAETKVKIENAMSDGIDRGKHIVQDECDAKIQQLEQDIITLKKENFDLRLLAKEPQSCLEKEQMKTTLAKLIFNAKNRQDQT
jgi:hypothetical protein